MTELTELTIKETARLLRLRSFSAAELLTAHAEQIERLYHQQTPTHGREFFDAFDELKQGLNDGSIRDWQRHTSQFAPGKNFMGTGGFGPWMVTTDDIPDVSRQKIATRLNGMEVQAAQISDLVFDVPALIAYCSTFTELAPGDVIVTGTTGGVGAYRTPPLWMNEGDVVEVEISGIGILRNPVKDEVATVAERAA